MLTCPPSRQGIFAQPRLTGLGRRAPIAVDRARPGVQRLRESQPGDMVFGDCVEIHGRAAAPVTRLFRGSKAGRYISLWTFSGFGACLRPARAALTMPPLSRSLAACCTRGGNARWSALRLLLSWATRQGKGESGLITFGG